MIGTPGEITLLVTDKSQRADRVVSLDLRHPDGAEVPQWEPGAHIDLGVGKGQFRQYSLCGDPSDRRMLTVAVLLDENGRGGSRYVHDVITTGSRVLIRGPRNHFQFTDSPRYLFIAGGIGITPLKPMIAAADRANREWHLLYCGRSRTTMSFLDELDAYGSRVTIAPSEETGRPDVGATLGELDPTTMVYCCGPEPLLDAVEQHCNTRGLDLRTEWFAPKDGADNGENLAFTVELAQSHRTLEVPTNRSLLDVLLDADIDILTSCEEGTCGTCEIGVFAGEVDHRDCVLSATEQQTNERMMVCVSRARSQRLILNL